MENKYTDEEWVEIRSHILWCFSIVEYQLFQIPRPCTLTEHKFREQLEKNIEEHHISYVYDISKIMLEILFCPFEEIALWSNSQPFIKTVSWRLENRI